MKAKFRILIIEDNQEKSVLVKDRIKAEIEELELDIHVVINLIDAIKCLSKEYFDLVLLDIRIPTSVANPSSENSRVIIEQFASGALVMPACVIGLTAFDEEYSKQAKYYEENLFSIEKFAADSDEWLNNIVSRIRFISRWKNSYGRSRSYDYDFDLVIVTSRYENEFQPILAGINWAAGPEDDLLLHKNSKLKTGLLRRGERVLKVCIYCTEEMGLSSAAAVTSHLIDHFRPRIVIMLGMCCGFQHDECQNQSKLGDVITVHSAACWDEGRYAELNNDGFFFNRAKAVFVDQKMDRVISSLLESGKPLFQDGINPLWNDKKTKQLRKKFQNDVREFPDIKYGLLLSGNSVIADDVKGGELLRRFPNALGLEMEMFGVFKAVDRAVGAAPYVMGVKGVADFGDGNKHKKFQATASLLSYAVGMTIVDRFLELHGS